MKTRVFLMRLITLTLVLIFSASFLALAAVPATTGTLVRQIFQDAQNDSGHWISAPSSGTTLGIRGSSTATVPVGTGFGAAKFQRASSTQTNLQYLNIVGNGGFYSDTDNMALQLWINPIKNSEKIEVGIISKQSTGNYYNALRVNIYDFIKITNTQFAVNNWQLITVPFKYFKDKGVLSNINSTMTTFNWSGLAGFTIAGTDELCTVNTGGEDWCFIDDVKYIKYVAAPQNLIAVGKESKITLSWTAPSYTTPTGYKIYRGDVEIADVATTTYIDQTAIAGTVYNYKVVSYNADAISNSVSTYAKTGTSTTVPTITDFYPFDNNVYTSTNQKISLRTIATGATQTTFYVDGVEYKVTGASPYVKNITNLNANGPIRIVAMAEDANGNTTSQIRTVYLKIDGTFVYWYQDYNIDSWISGSNIQNNEKSTDVAKAGIYSEKFTHTAKFDFAKSNIYNSNNSTFNMAKDKIAVQFWLYLRDNTINPSFLNSFNVSLISGTNIECRLPLSKYATTLDYQNWILVTIPFSDFYSSGKYFDASNVASTEAAFSWNNNFRGVGFNSNTSQLTTNAVFFVDDVAYVSYKSSSLVLEQARFTTLGNVISNISEVQNNSVRFNAEFANNNDTEYSKTIVIGYYKNGTLVNVQTTSGLIGKGRTLLTTGGVGKSADDVTQAGDVYTVKGFILNDLDNIQPYTVEQILD